MTAVKQSKIVKTFYRVFRIKKIQMSTEVLHVRCVCCVVSRFNHVWPSERMAYSPAGSLFQRILQAQILEWVAMSFSRGSSQSRD